MKLLGQVIALILIVFMLSIVLNSNNAKYVERHGIKGYIAKIWAGGNICQ
jgi:hypothetical protein